MTLEELDDLYSNFSQGISPETRSSINRRLKVAKVLRKKDNNARFAKRMGGRVAGSLVGGYAGRKVGSLVSKKITRKWKDRVQELEVELRKNNSLSNTKMEELTRLRKRILNANITSKSVGVTIGGSLGAGLSQEAISRYTGKHRDQFNWNKRA